MALDITTLIVLDEARTKEDRAGAETFAERVEAETLGRALLDGHTDDEARALAGEAAAGAREGYRTWVEVDPAAAYPAVIEEIRAQLAAPELTVSARYSTLTWLNTLMTRARRLPASAWDLALTPRDAVTGKRDLEQREEALEIARLWLTELIHAHVGRPLGVHILANPDWRL